MKDEDQQPWRIGARRDLDRLHMFMPRHRANHGNRAGDAWWPGVAAEGLEPDQRKDAQASGADPGGKRGRTGKDAPSSQGGAVQNIGCLGSVLDDVCWAWQLG